MEVGGRAGGDGEDGGGDGSGGGKGDAGGGGLRRSKTHCVNGCCEVLLKGQVSSDKSAHTHLHVWSCVFAGYEESSTLHSAWGRSVGARQRERAIHSCARPGGVRMTPMKMPTRVDKAAAVARAATAVQRSRLRRLRRRQCLKAVAQEMHPWMLALPSVCCNAEAGVLLPK